jgi:hypothetical protein
MGLRDELMLVAALLAGPLLGACSGDRTLVVVDVDGPGLPAIDTLRATIVYAGTTGDLDFPETAGASIGLPTTLGLRLSNPTDGPIIATIAGLSGGTEVGRGAASGEVLVGHTLRLAVTLVAPSSDAGADAGSDGGLDGGGTDGASDGGTNDAASDAATPDAAGSDAGTDAAPICGDGACDATVGETCTTCAADCGLCPFCGDGVVNPGETCDPPDGVSCDASCQIISACAMDVGTIGCGSVVSGTNTMAGSTDVVDAWTGCPTVVGESGAEVAYAFVSPFSEYVTFDVTGLGADLDLAVLTGPPQCDPSTCIDFSNNSGLTPESVGPLETVGGQPYYVVIDGYASAASAYTLSATCTGPLPPPITGTGSCADPFVIDGSSAFALIDDRLTCAGGDDSTAPSLADCTGAGNGPDLVYRLDLGFDASVSLDLWDNDGTAGIDVVLYLGTTCGGGELDCNDDVGGQPRHAHLDTTLLAGVYYLTIDESLYTDGGGVMFTCGTTELTITAM